MKRYLFPIFFLFLAVSLNAQTLRPDVFIVGNGNAAVAAAIQAAQSNVKTTLLLQAGGFDITPLDNNLSSGVEAKFLEKIRMHKSLTDTIAPVTFDKQTANIVLEQWTNTLKNLTVIRNVQWLKADRSGKGWVFKLSDGKTIRPEVFVNVADEKLNTALNIEAPKLALWSKFSYETSIFKTNIAVGKEVDGSARTMLSMYQLLMPTQENLVYVSDASSMLMGQSAGAVAAYAGFFNLKTSESNLKKIQGELIAFSTNLMPFADIGLKDPNWKAMQMVGLTAVIKGDEQNGKLHFNPEKLVTTEEIKQPIKDHYYKAQIWFDDYKNDIMTIGAAVDMICYVGNKAPESTKRELEKKWQTAYAFSSSLDFKRQINRRELATLLQDYMPPFNVTIDKAGKILR